MNEITLTKRQYHLNGEMERWCREFIGEGGWTYSSPVKWEGMGDKIWVMHSIFGNTTFSFKNPEDATAFALRWA